MRSLIILGILTGVGCSSHKLAIGGTCHATTECASGNFCVKGVCAAGAQCSTNGDCSAAQVCTASGICSVTSGGGGGGTRLSVTGVSGDTPAAAAPAPGNGTSAPEGFWTSVSFLVTGTGFDSSLTAALVDNAQHPYDLVVSAASATTFSAALPATLTPGTYALRVTTATGGTVSPPVSILQGPPGVAGATGTTGAVGTVPPTLTSSSAAAPTLTITNTGSNGVSLAASGRVDLGGASVRLPIIYVTATNDSQNGSGHLTAGQPTSSGSYYYRACPADHPFVIGGGCILSPNITSSGIYVLESCAGQGAGTHCSQNDEQGQQGSSGWVCHFSVANPDLDVLAICLAAF